MTKMKRTTLSFPIPQDARSLHEAIVTILKADGYSEKPYNKAGMQETVWKMGTGIMTAMHFIKLDYQPGTLVVQGWIASGIGSLTFGEQDLSGVFGVIPKKSVQATIDKIAKLVNTAATGQPQA